MLDPRTKLLLALGYAFLVVASGKARWLLAEGIALLAFLVFLGLGRSYGRWLRMVLPMTLFFGAVVWWTADGNMAFISAVKLLNLITVFFVFFNSTLPEDLGNALAKMGMPYAVAFVISTSLQFVPAITFRVRNVLDAQQARGIPLEPGWQALRHYAAFLGPVLIQSFQMAEALAEAMEARGFARSGRTFMRDYRMLIRDWTVLFGALAAVIVCLLAQSGSG